MAKANVPRHRTGSMQLMEFSLLSLRQRIQAAKNVRRIGRRSADAPNLSHDLFHTHSWTLASTNQWPNNCWPVEQLGAK